MLHSKEIDGYLMIKPPNSEHTCVNKKMWIEIQAQAAWQWIKMIFQDLSKYKYTQKTDWLWLHFAVDSIRLLMERY